MIEENHGIVFRQRAIGAWASCGDEAGGKWAAARVVKYQRAAARYGVGVAMKYDRNQNSRKIVRMCWRNRVRRGGVAGMLRTAGAGLMPPSPRHRRKGINRVWPRDVADNQLSGICDPLLVAVHCRVVLELARRGMPKWASSKRAMSAHAPSMKA